MASFDPLRRKLEEEALRLAEDAADIIAERLDDVVPRDSGTLADSQEIRVFVNGPKVSAKIGYSAPHAKFTDEGGDPHPIVAKNVSFLLFEGTNERAGTTVLVPSVNHPGSEGTKWYSDNVTASAWSVAIEAAKN